MAIREIILEPYQSGGITKISLAAKRSKKVLVVSPTGSGKTVVMAEIAVRSILKMLEGTDECVTIFVHRKELMNQIRSTLMDCHDIHSYKIDSKTNFIPSGIRVFVCMVETYNKRAENESFSKFFVGTKLTMFDEAHLSHFKKIFKHFPDAIRIGFTATPIAATKKDPLKNYYEELVILTTVKELIALNQEKPNRGVIPARELYLGNVSRADIKMKKNGDFDEDDMGNKLSNAKQIQNTLDAYITHCYGQKTICFNANIDHSLKMTAAFILEGIPARHLDGDKSGPFGSDSYREDCFKWLKETPNAVLCNVGIATTGTDEPSIQCVIVNKMVSSFPLFKQMIGRGGRPYMFTDGTFMEYFTILDMGDNMEGGKMGHYDDDIDWASIFYEPKLPRPTGVSAVKTCPECKAINYASARICAGLKYDWLSEEDVECLYVFGTTSPVEDMIAKKMIEVNGKINVKGNIQFFIDSNEYRSYYEAFRQMGNICRDEFDSDTLDSLQIEEIYKVMERKASEWHKLKGKRRFPNFKLDVFQKTVQCLKDAKFMIMAEEESEALISLGLKEPEYETENDCLEEGLC